MGNDQSSQKPKVCLVPPLIRRRRVRPICANEFLYFGFPTTELLSDWLIEGSTISTDMILKPQIRIPEGQLYNPDAVPELAAFIRGSTALPHSGVPHIQPSELKKSAVGMLALEARWKNQIRAMVSMEGSDSKQPKVYFGLGRENLKGTSFFASFDPRRTLARCDFGLTQATQYGTLGLSATIDGHKDLPSLGAWAAVRPLPEISIGANIKMEPSASGYVPEADFALNIRDPHAVIYDRPAYEIALIAKNRGASYHLSYFQHFVTRRRIQNPMEEDHVTHITNYIDVGAEVAVEAESMSFGIGTSWQINKNNLVKGRLNQNGAQASYIFKTWANPSFIVALTTGLNFQTGRPMHGIAVTCEAALGQPEFDRAGINYEEVQVVRYGAELAPEMVNRYDMINDDAPVLKHFPPQMKVIVPPPTVPGAKSDSL